MLVGKLHPPGTPELNSGVLVRYSGDFPCHEHPEALSRGGKRPVTSKLSAVWNGAMTRWCLQVCNHMVPAVSLCMKSVHSFICARMATVCTCVLAMGLLTEPEDARVNFQGDLVSSCSVGSNPPIQEFKINNFLFRRGPLFV